MNKLKPLLLLALCVAAVILGALLFDDKLYAWISLFIAGLAVVPFFLRFEKKRANSVRKRTDTLLLIILAVMVALSVAGRLLFAAVPGFKPVTALVVITALTFGGEAGFMTGALTAVLSNFYFGQGPWTPFQMVVWGMIGLVAGLLSAPLKKSRVLLCVYGVLSGVAYSLTMDVWSVLWMDNAVIPGRYLTAVTASIPFMVVYAASNVIFLLLLAKPIGQKLERVHTKYGV